MADRIEIPPLFWDMYNRLGRLDAGEELLVPPLELPCARAVASLSLLPVRRVPYEELQRQGRNVRKGFSIYRGLELRYKTDSRCDHQWERLWIPDNTYNYIIGWSKSTTMLPKDPIEIITHFANARAPRDKLLKRAVHPDARFKRYVDIPFRVSKGAEGEVRWTKPFREELRRLAVRLADMDLFYTLYTRKSPWGLEKRVFDWYDSVGLDVTRTQVRAIRKRYKLFLTNLEKRELWGFR